MAEFLTLPIMRWNACWLNVWEQTDDCGASAQISMSWGLCAPSAGKIVLQPKGVDHPVVEVAKKQEQRGVEQKQ